MSILDRLRRFRRWALLRSRLSSIARAHPELLAEFLLSTESDASDTLAALRALSERRRVLKNFSSEFESYSSLLRSVGRAPLREQDAYPCLSDRTLETGFDRHYIYHPAWAARMLAKYHPERHVDISSTLSFCTMVSAFVPVDFYDFRPAPLVLPGLSSGAADLMALPFDTGSIESLSCMHVIEHIGLGRYGDPVDVDGDKKAGRELSRVLASGGHLIVVMPVGRPRIQFNAHRIYSFEQVLGLFPELTLLEHALIPDGAAETGLIPNPASDLIMAQSYGCGCYVFTR